MTKQTKEQVNKKYPKRNGYYYTNRQGNEFKFPSITNVLGVVDKPYLVVWAAKKCAEIALDNPTLTVDEVYAIHRKRDITDAGTRGKGMHNLAPKVLSGEEIPVELSEKYGGFVKGLVKFLQENKPIELFNERPVISFKYGIGGTTDWGLKVGNEKWLTDIKTSPRIYRSHKLQLSFYEDALKEEGEVFDKCKIIHLPGDETYALYDVAEDLSVLPHMKAVWEWVKDDRG